MPTVLTRAELSQRGESCAGCGKVAGLPIQSQTIRPHALQEQAPRKEVTGSRAQLLTRGAAVGGLSALQRRQLPAKVPHRWVE